MKNTAPTDIEFNAPLIAALVKEYHDASYFIRGGYYREFLQNNCWLGAKQIEFFEGAIFALLKPDCLASGKAKATIEWLEKAGYTILHIEPIWRPSEREFEEIYKYNLTIKNEQNQIGSWWINRKTYTVGPSLMLILGRSDGRNVYKTLSDHKGDSDPNQTQKGELRHDLDAYNITLNLFHCSDDPLSSLREFLIFRTTSDFLSLTKAFDMQGIQTVSIWRNEWPVIELALNEPIDFDPARTLRRLVACLCSQLGIVRPIRPLLEQERTETHAIPMAQRLAKTLEVLKNIRNEIENGNFCEPSAALHDLTTLLNYPSVEEQCLEACLNRMNSYQIEVSEWQKVALISTCHYERRTL